jgi:hypothetical protein
MARLKEVLIHTPMTTDSKSSIKSTIKFSALIGGGIIPSPMSGSPPPTGVHRIVNGVNGMTIVI